VSAEAAAAAAAAALDRRRYSYEVHRRKDNDDDDDDDAATPLIDRRPLWRPSVSSPTVSPQFHPHRDNAVVLVEVICHGGAKQQARTPTRPRPRSASESPSKRSRAASPVTGQVTGPASDSEITTRRTHSRRLSCDNASAILQVCVAFLLL